MNTASAKLGLVIDLDVCVGCHGCAVSCKQWNTSGTTGPLTDMNPYGPEPEGVWFNRIRSYEVGNYPDNKTVNTRAFRAAFADAASAIGNGSAAAATVRAAGPGVYVTGCFNLTSWITFEVATAATVFGVQDDSTEQYTVIAPLPSYGTSRDNGAATRHQALIM